MRKIRTLSPLIQAFAAAAALALLGSIDEQEIECEEAFAHLQSCCETLGPEPVCGAGCVSLTLSLEESACIKERGCEELRAAEVCERVIALEPDLENESAPHAAVCP